MKEIILQQAFEELCDAIAYYEEKQADLVDGVPKPKLLPLGSGHGETRIGQKADEGEPTTKVFKLLLDHCRVYHFHDTSPTARVRQFCYIGDNRRLIPDAGNLAAFLLRLREGNGGAYQRILSTIRLIAPFFDDFNLEAANPNKKDIILNWRDKGSDQVFGPHQLSDGTLRAICLVTLLMQPESDLPDLIIVDEPELGLHPYALNMLPALFKKASHHSEKQIATLKAIADGYVTPEMIDDGPHSTPNKRIIKELPDYEDAKPVVGPQVAELIGMDLIRTKCPHFAAWLGRLENLGERMC